MLVVVDLDGDALVDPGSVARLAELAARFELVLVCPALAVFDSALSRIRAVIPRHQVVGVLVDGEPSPAEREVVDDLLNGGVVPLIMTVGTSTVDAYRLERWLQADLWLRLSDLTPTHPPRVPTAA
jgi:hypothetical protein